MDTRATQQFRKIAAIVLGLVLAVALAADAEAQQKKGTRAKAKKNRETIWVNEPAPNTLPEGTTHHTYFSESMQHDVGYCIYLPPGYASDATRRYPVIYSLHGAGGDELRVVDAAKVLHDGIVSGRWPEMILVAPNGGKTSLYMDSYDGKVMAETTVIKELIPHVDATYRTIAARHGRCIEGFSMGGRGSTKLALKYPEMFCSLFNQAGNVYHVADTFDTTGSQERQAGLGPDKQRYIDNDPYLLLEKNLDQIKSGLRIQVFCGTQDDTHLPSVREFHAALLKAGVDHTYMEIERMAHERTRMIAQYAPIWFDYHVESLRMAAAAAERGSGKRK